MERFGLRYVRGAEVIEIRDEGERESAPGQGWWLDGLPRWLAWMQAGASRLMPARLGSIGCR